MSSLTSDPATSAPIRVAALYRFAPIEDTAAVRDILETACLANEVRGTLLVAEEGINGTIAGPPEGVQVVIQTLRGLAGFADLDVKYADADEPPFLRLKVRIKKEIVTLGVPGLDPRREAGVYVAPQDWNALIADPRTLVIDTRNDYEGRIGAFEGAIQPNTRSFRDFPAWFRTEGRALMQQAGADRVAMYCTGGIRCEKATAFLKAEGVEGVHHLEGGILRYLETTPQDQSLWNGECFVFDERVAVGHGLSAGSHALCRACRMPVSPEDQASPDFVEGVSCPHCRTTRNDDQRGRYAERQRQVEIADRRGVAHIGGGAPEA